MKKSEVNFVINLCMFISMAMLAGIGLLIKYILIPGEKRWAVYGNNIDLRFWGLDRHQWGTVHLIIALLLVALLLLHLILHWKSITCVYRRMVKNAGLRLGLGILLICVTLAMIVSPFIIEVEKSEVIKRGERHRKNSAIIQTPENVQDTILAETDITPDYPSVQGSIEEEIHGHHYQDIDIKGYMTLEVVTGKFEIPLETLIAKLNLPENIDKETRLGHLRRKYGLSMSDIKDIIIKLKKQ